MFFPTARALCKQRSPRPNDWIHTITAHSMYPEVTDTSITSPHVTGTRVARVALLFPTCQSIMWYDQVQWKRTHHSLLDLNFLLSQSNVNQRLLEKIF